MINTILFDIGDTLVHAAPPGTAVQSRFSRPVHGALRTLQALSARYRLGAVTDTDTAVMTSPQVREALAGIGLAELLEVIVTVDVGTARPDPRDIRRALTQLGTEPGEALFVGDTTADAEAAQAAVGAVRLHPARP